MMGSAGFFRVRGALKSITFVEGREELPPGKVQPAAIIRARAAAVVRETKDFRVIAFCPFFVK